MDNQTTGAALHLAVSYVATFDCRTDADADAVGVLAS